MSSNSSSVTNLSSRIVGLAMMLIALIGLPAHAQQDMFTVAGDGNAAFFGESVDASTAQLNDPLGLTVDAAGNIYFVDADNHRIRMIATNGVISTVAGTGTPGFSGDGGAATAAQIDSPTSVDVDNAGNIYFADTGNERIRMFQVGGTISTVAGNGLNGNIVDGTAATSAPLREPRGVTVDAATGEFYFFDNGFNRIYKVDSGSLINQFAGNGDQGSGGDGSPALSAQLGLPQSLHLDGTGLYIADTLNHRIRVVDTASGIISLVAGSSAGFRDGAAVDARFRSPRGVTTDAAGNVYVADHNGHRIRMVDTAGMVSTVAGTGTGGFNGDGQVATQGELNDPYGIVVDGAGDVYFTDSSNHRLRVLTTATPNNAPTDMTLSNDTIMSTDPDQQLVGSFSVTDADGGDVHVFSKVAGDGDTDNDLFSLGSNNLRAKTPSTMLNGPYSVRIQADDQVDATFVKVFTINVTVPDMGAPVITLTGDNPQVITVGDAYTELGATATDDVDGDLTASIVIDASAVDTTTIGDYTVTYSVTDTAGNMTSVDRTVSVVAADTTAPVITLTGSNPQVISLGGSYVELGATAVDDVDGDISANIVIDSSAVNTATAGSYMVTYSVQDAAGNMAMANRTVTVQAPAPPPPPPPPVSSGGGSFGLFWIALLAGLAFRRRSRWLSG